MKTILAGMSLCALFLAGCVTVESTRAQLASADPQEVSRAKETVFYIATADYFDVRQQIEYIKLVPEREMLLRILDHARRGEVRAYAAEKLNLSEPGLAMEIFTKHRDVLHLVKGYEGKVIGCLSEAELEKAYKCGHDLRLDENLWNRVAVALIAKTQKPSTLLSLYKDTYLKYETRMTARDRIVDVSDKLTDAKRLELLEDRQTFSKLDARAKLLTGLSGKAAVEFVQKAIQRHSVTSWLKGDLMPFEDAVIVTHKVKDPALVTRVVAAMLKALASYEGNDWGWDSDERDKEDKLLKKLPKFGDSVIESLICMDETSWKYLANSISVNVAYAVLANGKAKSDELERKLVEMLPAAKVDMKVYKGVRFDETRKAVMAKMPPELKKAAAEDAEKAFHAICEKAKSAAKETFELDGFYLGMTFDDMKVVFAHHFPNLEIKEAIDGEGKNADHVIYVPGQSSPFCYAGVSDKKVWRFNFGKKLLKKWYSFDVQSPAEWAMAYGRATKADMRFKLIEKDATVYEPMDMSTSYRVWFHQESYQFKNNTKEYRLTYFGEQKDFTCEGGIGGAVIKAMAEPRFRYVRGDFGSLRAQIERD